MDIIKIIMMALSLVVALAGSISPLAMKLLSANKARKAAVAEAENAKTEAERAAAEAAKEKAVNDMIATAQELVKSAETAFAGLDAVMKQRNSSAGAMKKEHVTAKLQTYALAHGYEYDAEYWSAKIDEIVAFTREVNAKNKTIV